jgi:hypothetical protein
MLLSMPFATELAAMTELERELLELCCMGGERTTVLDEELLEASPGRAVVEAALNSLVARGLMSMKRVIAVSPRRSDGARDYEDAWWEVTPAGRAALGLPETKPQP